MATSSKSKGQGGLTGESRAAAKAAFEALEQWRDDMASANEKYSKKVFDQMAKAAKAMGWPSEIIDQTRKQMQDASQMQLQMMDRVMVAWSEQIDSPNAAMPMPTDFIEQLQRMQATAMTSASGMTGGNGFGGVAMAPFQMWMQAAEMWQRNMASAMSMWTGGMSDKQRDR